MKYYNILFGLLCIFGLIGFSFATNFNSCGTFALSDTYDQTDNIQVNGSTCLTIAIPVPTSRTVIDCHGYYIEGNLSAGTRGVAMILSNDVTIQNCVFRNFEINFASTDGDNILIQNSTFDNASASGLQLCTSTICQNLTFINNTVSNSFNNGIENYGSNNSIFNNNTCNNQEHGHGTDRCYQNVRNVYNTEFAYNWVWNNTIGIRSDNTNVSNFSAHHNRFENFSQGLNMQTTSGTFNLFNFSDNNLSSTAYNSTGFDITFPASATKESDCSNITLNNNIVTGGDFWYLNELNSSQIISNSIIGGMIICNADNVQLYNLTLIGGGGGRNAIELLYNNNLTLVDYHAMNIYTSLRGLISNDSVFRNIEINGGQISAINFAGGGSNRNNITNFTITNFTANSGMSWGGTNNYALNGYIYNASSSGTPLNIQSATTAINNTFENITVENTERGMGITNVGSGNVFRNIQLINVTNAFVVNSTASGTKTITLDNITLSDASQSYFVTFSLFDTIDPSEVYIINQPFNFGSIPSFPNASFVDLQSYLNRTQVSLSANTSIDSLSMTVFETPVDFSRLTWWTYNGTDWVQQAITNHGNGTISVSGIKVYPSGAENLDNIFYYDQCPVINQSGTYYQFLNYSGAPNTGSDSSPACLLINASDVSFSCLHPQDSTFGNITNDATPLAVGVYVEPSLTNVSLLNCYVDSYDRAVSVSGSNQINLDGNSFVNSVVQAITVSSSSLNSITNNIFSGNNVDISSLITFDNNLISLNNFSTSSFMSMQLFSASNNNISLNRFDNNPTSIYLGSGSNSNNVTNNMFLDALAGDQIYLESNNLNRVVNNSQMGGSSQITLINTNNTQVLQNTLTMSSVGIVVDGASENSLISQNTIQGSTGNGINLTASGSNNNVSSNSIQTVMGTAIYVTAPNSYLSYNSISSDPIGFQIGSNSSTFNNNNISSTSSGIIVFGGSGNLIQANNLSLASLSAIDLNSGSSTNLVSNEISDSTIGINITGGNNTLGSDNHFYNNIYAIYIDTSVNPRQLNLNNSIFDLDGTFTNYSNVSLLDTALSSESYSLNWSYQPDYAATGNLSYRNSSINLSIYNPSTITSIIFNYLDSGLNSTNELTMKIFQYNGTWNTTGSTVDTTNNKVTLLGFGSDAILSLLYDVASPILITSTTINYYSSHSYSSYSVTGGEITTLDTGLFDIGYNGSGTDPTLISPITVLIVMIPIVAIGLLIIGVNRFFRSDDV